MKIGITGQSGFIGGYLYNFLRLQPNVERIEFSREFWDSPEALSRFAEKCDIIIHLAAVSRADDGEKLFNTNMLMIEKLIAAMDNARFSGTVMLGSTTHIRELPYHKSKAAAHDRLTAWSQNRPVREVTLLMPNTFGPFSKPFWNSVVATFAWQIAHGKTVDIQQDAELKLISVNTLAKAIFNLCSGSASGKVEIPHELTCTVTELRDRLTRLSAPAPLTLTDNLDAALFTALQSYQN